MKRVAGVLGIVAIGCVVVAAVAAQEGQIDSPQRRTRHHFDGARAPAVAETAQDLEIETASGGTPGANPAVRGPGTPPAIVACSKSLAKCQSERTALADSLQGRLERQQQQLQQVLDLLHRKQAQPLVKPRQSDNLADSVDALLEAVVTKASAR